MKLLFDADVLCYQASATTQSEIDWGDGDIIKSGDLPRAQEIFHTLTEKYMTELMADSFELCWSSSGNFRKEILPTYKEHRKKSEKPMDYEALYYWALKNYPSHSIPTLEGDDVLGILTTRFPEQYIMVSIDKDLLGIPGRFYRLGVHGKPSVMHHTSPEAAQKFFLTQVLMGDSTDNYFGIPGIGPKKAEKILEEGGYNWATIVAAYEKAGLTEEDALVQARCAKILDNRMYHLGEVKLWTPDLLI